MRTLSTLLVISVVSVLSGSSMLSAQTGGDPFTREQWGLSNRGEAQRIELDHITAYRVQARAGEDVKLPPKVKAQKKILVAVLDTGVDHNHPDLQAVLHRNESECAALDKFRACVTEKSRAECEKTWMDLKNPEVDQDHNGYPLDCSGWSILGGTNAAGIMGRPDFGDDQGHGTHVAGIIGASQNNGLGVRGVSDNVEILSVQVLGNKPTEPIKPLSVDQPPKTLPPPTAKPPGAPGAPGAQPPPTALPPKPGTPQKPADPLDPKEEGKQGVTRNLADLVARGVTYAIRSGAQVINFSMGWPQNSDSEYLRQVIAEAQKRGIIIVAAAGNDSTRALLRPCAYPGVICVAAHGPDGSLSHFSNYGSGVEIAAPGTNILSTYPMEKRPVRFRSVRGFEFLNGTSQASPFVAGAVAEMLARGIPASEIYARLVLSGRALKEKLPLLEGAPEDLQQERQAESSLIERKWVTGGLLDLSQALTVTPEAVILPAQKEKIAVKWDTKAQDLVFQFPFKNYWKEIDPALVQVTARSRKLSQNLIRPRVIDARILEGGGVWKTGETKTLQITARIEDAAPGESEIPSEMDFDVLVTTPTRVQKLVLESEIIVPVDPATPASNWQKIPLLKMPMARSSLIPIDENLDGKAQTDYIAIVTESNNNTYHLVKYDPVKRVYETKNSIKVRLGEDFEKAREQYLIRMDLDGSGQSKYVLGIYIDKSEDGKASPVKFHFLDENFTSVGQLELSGEKAQTPARVYWHQIGGQKRPAWVGPGYDPAKKPSLRDDWENPDGLESKKIRFYYVDLLGSLKAIEKFQGYQIIDVMEPTLDQVKAGRVPILLAKNRGTTMKPSYIYDFAVAEVQEGKIINFESLDFSLDQRFYRNLLDTRVDKVMNLDLKGEADPARGTYWFGEGPNRSQRISVLTRENGKFKFYDQTLSALRGTVDASLWVRAAFAGHNDAGAFVFTNSEIQYHDLIRDQVAVKSFERYTFYPDLLFSNLHFPMVVKDKKSNSLRPGLFTTESSGFSRGVRIKVPVRNSQGDLIEIATPARLRLESQRGCRPLETPIRLEDGSTALDYYCGNEILRVPIEL